MVKEFILKKISGLLNNIGDEDELKKYHELKNVIYKDTSITNWDSVNKMLNITVPYFNYLELGDWKYRFNYDADCYEIIDSDNNIRTYTKDQTEEFIKDLEDNPYLLTLYFVEIEDYFKLGHLCKMFKLQFGNISLDNNIDISKNLSNLKIIIKDTDNPYAFTIKCKDIEDLDNTEKYIKLNDKAAKVIFNQCMEGYFDNRCIEFDNDDGDIYSSFFRKLANMLNRVL